MMRVSVGSVVHGSMSPAAVVEGVVMMIVLVLAFIGVMVWGIYNDRRRK